MAEQHVPAGQFLDAQQRYVMELLNQVNALREQNSKLLNLCQHQKNVVAGLEAEKIELMTQMEGLNHQLLALTTNAIKPEPDELQAIDEPYTGETPTDLKETDEITQDHAANLNAAIKTDDTTQYGEPHGYPEGPIDNEVIMDVPVGDDAKAQDTEPPPSIFATESPFQSVQTQSPNIPSDASERATRTMPSFEGSEMDQSKTPPLPDEL